MYLFVRTESTYHSKTLSLNYFISICYLRQSEMMETNKMSILSVLLVLISPAFSSPLDNLNINPGLFSPNSKIEKYKIIPRYHISQWLLLRGLLLHTVPYSFLSFSKLTKLIIPIITLSGKVGGMASLAGAPYVSIYEATDEEILEMAQSLASNGLIDSLENMRDDNIYIFQGLVDSITPWCKSLLSWRNNYHPIFRAGRKN